MLLETCSLGIGIAKSGSSQNIPNFLIAGNSMSLLQLEVY
jgi:hypothetical protein